LNWDEAQSAFRDGTVDGQENPVALIVPYRLYIAHKHITLWHYVIDPLILAVSAKTWASLSAADRAMLQKAAQAVMGEQKKEARGARRYLGCGACLACGLWNGRRSPYSRRPQSVSRSNPTCVREVGWRDWL
jgi:hypothetical protein